MSNNRRTVSDIKTAVKAKVHSRPRVRGSEFLEMFILEKNKARLEQERAQVEKRQELIDRDLGAIADELDILAASIAETKDVLANNGSNKKQRHPKSLKMMKLDY